MDTCEQGPEEGEAGGRRPVGGGYIGCQCEPCRFEQGEAPNKHCAKQLHNINLSAADLTATKLVAADLRAANLRGATLEGADLADADMHSADLTGAVLCGAAMQGARGGRDAAVPVASPKGGLISHLKVGKPVVMALTACAGLRLASVALTNQFGSESGHNASNCAQGMEVQTGPSAAGPWTSVLRFTSARTTAPQTLAAPADAPVLAGYVQVLVHDTYGGYAYPRVTSMELAGTAWG